MVSAGVLEPGFISSAALNFYHDGTEGIAAHYDDAERFCQPIVSLVRAEGLPGLVGMAEWDCCGQGE